ncbi:MAG: peptidase MA family metallohydrolase [Armatimonadota bacterium]
MRRLLPMTALCLLAVLATASLAVAEPVRRVLGTEHLRISYWPEHEELAEIARDTGSDALTRLRGMLDVEPEKRIDVYIVRSRKEFDELTGAKNKPWTLGRAIPGIMRVVVKPMGPQRLPKLLAHELAHIMLDVRMGEDAHLLTRWLHEGIAKYAADDFEEAERRVIADAALSDELLTIDELDEAFRGDREQVSLAYAQSYTLVEYLSEIRPADGISPLLEQLAEGRDMRLALGLAFGRPVPRMEEEWREGLRTGYMHHVAPPLGEAIIGGLFVISFAIAWFFVRRRSARIRERMRLEEERRQAERQERWPPPGPYTVLPMSGTKSAEQTEDDVPIE